MTVRIELRRDQRNRALHSFFWVEPSQISRILGPPDPSKPALLVDDRGEELAWGLYSPQSPFPFRALSFRGAHGLAPLADRWLETRLDHALNYRQQLFAPDTYSGYRIVNSEGDGLPGLVIDRYGEVDVIAITTASLFAQRAAVQRWAQQHLGPTTIWLVPQSAQEREDFTAPPVQIQGEAPPYLNYLEDGLRIQSPTPPAQKTGAYHDQRDNRRRFAELAHRFAARHPRGSELPNVDLGAHVGGFSLQMARRGLACIAVDQSAAALDYVQQNAQANQLNTKIQIRQGDMFGDLDQLGIPETIASAVIDPPKIVLRPRDRKKAIHAMSKICARIWPRMLPGAYLALCSCSHHLGAEHLDASLWAVVTQRGEMPPPRIALWGPGLDHPTMPGHESGRYLSVAVYQKRGA